MANDELLEMLSDLKQDPLKTLTPNLNAECIILRNTINGKREQIDYPDTPTVKRCETISASSMNVSADTGQTSVSKMKISSHSKSGC